MASSFAQQMVAKYEELLLQCAGAQSIVVDGQNVSLTDLEEKWQFWSKEYAKSAGHKPRIAVIKMGGV